MTTEISITLIIVISICATTIILFFSILDFLLGILFAATLSVIAICFLVAI